MSNPTIDDIAARAGVSRSTVSRLLTGTGKVSASARAAIGQAMAALDFLPSAPAKSLRTGHTGQVGVVLHDIESQFLAMVLRGIEDGLAPFGHVPVLASMKRCPHLAEDVAALLRPHRLAGLILLPCPLADSQILALAAAQPIVVAGRPISGERVCSVSLDQARGAYAATAHLLSLGHRRIAHISGPPDHSDSAGRIAGFLQAHRADGLAHDPALVVPGDFHEAGGERAAEQLLAGGHRFTALFAANDQTARGATLAFYRHGLQVPRDISVVGFDDLPSSAFLTPPLTTVRQPMRCIGLAAASRLLRLMGLAADEAPLPALELVVRDSTCPPARFS